ncbi:hypothetical protein BD779DRAFT_838080 [Infundibulicybe gibba]|nr:hypothetical protein BD779DRAFT_838080 [Infundibulicybe gibba]
MLKESSALMIAHYYAEPSLPWRWSIMVLQDANEGCIFELTGNTHTFSFGSRKVQPDISYRGACLLGWVPTSTVEALEARLRKVPIHRHREGWDSQNWVLNAVRWLQDDQIIEPITEEMIRDELAHEVRRRSSYRRTLEDRLFPDPDEPAETPSP